MGWDAVHTGDIGMASASDHAILEYARTYDRIIITLDADFHTILALSNAKNPSVVRLRLQGLGDFQQRTYRHTATLGSIRMSHFGSSGLRIKRFSIVFIANFVSDMPFS